MWLTSQPTLQSLQVWFLHSLPYALQTSIAGFNSHNLMTCTNREWLVSGWCVLCSVTVLISDCVSEFRMAVSVCRCTVCKKRNISVIRKSHVSSFSFKLHNKGFTIGAGHSKLALRRGTIWGTAPLDLLRRRSCTLPWRFDCDAQRIS